MARSPSNGQEVEENCAQLGADLGLKPFELRRFEKALALHNQAQRRATDERDEPEEWDENPFGFGPCA